MEKRPGLIKGEGDAAEEKKKRRYSEKETEARETPEKRKREDSSHLWTLPQNESRFNSC